MSGCEQCQQPQEENTVPDERIKARPTYQQVPPGRSYAELRVAAEGFLKYLLNKRKVRSIRAAVIDCPVPGNSPIPLMVEYDVEDAVKKSIGQGPVALARTLAGLLTRVFATPGAEGSQLFAYCEEDSRKSTAEAPQREVLLVAGALESRTDEETVAYCKSLYDKVCAEFQRKYESGEAIDPEVPNVCAREDVKEHIFDRVYNWKASLQDRSVPNLMTVIAKARFEVDELGKMTKLLELKSMPKEQAYRVLCRNTDVRGALKKLAEAPIDLSDI